jgi:hypothetical protein
MRSGYLALMLSDGLVSWKRRLEEAEDSETFLSLWRQALAWLGSADPTALTELLNGALRDTFRGILAPFQRRYLGLEECAVAARLAEGELQGEQALSRLLEIPFARQTYERVAEALELIDFERCRRFINIGCGPFPAASLLIHERTTIPQMVAVDNDPTAIELATRMVRRLASPRLEVASSDGTSYDYQGADVIYVANHVFPKSAVLHRIAMTASPGTKVLVREPCGRGLLFAELGCASLPANLRILREGADDPNFYSKHVLCVLDAGSAAEIR